MKFAVLLLFSAASAFVPAAPEGLVMTYVEKLHWSTPMVAIFCAAGQCASFAGLYLFGEWLMQRWQRLAREVERVRQRFANHLERRFLMLAGLAGLFGFPPAIAMSVLGGGFKIPLAHLMPLMFVTRVVRFSGIVYFGDKLGHWLHALP